MEIYSSKHTAISIAALGPKSLNSFTMSTVKTRHTVRTIILKLITNE
jgi:hypothetical protein